MKCKLCHKVSKLCDSHIIPEFLYKPSYDEKHRAQLLIVEPNKDKLLQKGFREQLLCVDCEGEFSKLETYVSKLWQKQIPAEIPDDLLVIKGLDYTQFKLFHLSILWRASISSRKEFKHVQLGQHEDIIRKLLLAKDAGPEDRYSFFATILVHKDKPVHGLINQPFRSRLDSHHAYVFVFGSCIWYYLISSHSPKQYIDICFSKKGELFLVKKEMTDNKIIKDFAMRYQDKRTVVSKSG